MAVRNATVVINNQGVCVVTWPDLDTGDTGQPVLLGMYADKTVQVIGTGDIPMEGSNDGTNWEAVKDFGGTAITLNAANGKLQAIRENPLYIRVGAVATASNNVVILIAKATGR